MTRCFLQRVFVLGMVVFFMAAGMGWAAATSSSWNLLLLSCESFSEVTSNGRIWMDRNLGACRVATSTTDSEAYGDLYQWGRPADGHEDRKSGITSINSSDDVPGHSNFIVEPDTPFDWRATQDDNLWQGPSGTNNPCPAGFRLPTSTELDAEMKSWVSEDPDGAFGSPLKLVMAGYRNQNGDLLKEGEEGRYWSSTVEDTRARGLGFFALHVPPDANISGKARAWGVSVRCIKD